eukprot:TRINITY_DN20434_c0_g2_i1.p1 TRINITY_DN20434_c0_g2~~TRINITY_DN20434_c0_g2_i1.p1  ORF type:complete len:660 (+),score=152.26 TRINITY_DN20434_c0_g2_i1:52-2031(+)
MGCGGSTAVGVPSDAKYTLAEPGGGVGSKTPGRAAVTVDKQKTLTSDNKEDEAKVEKPPFKGGLHYACFRNRVRVKTQAGTESFADLRLLATGCMGVERTPLEHPDARPGEPLRTIRVAPDFSSRFSLLVPQSLAVRLLDTISEIEESEPRKAVKEVTPRTPTVSPPPAQISPSSPTGGDSTAVVPPNTPKYKRKGKPTDKRRLETATSAAAAFLLPKMTPLVLRDINVRVVSGQSKSVSCIALSSDEKMIALGALVMQDLAMRAAQLNATSKRDISESAQKDMSFVPCALGLTGNPSHFRKYETKPFLAQQQYTVRTYDVRLGRIISVFTDKHPDLDPQINSIFFGPENQHIYTGSINVDCWDVSRKRKTKSLETDPSFGLTLCTAMSPCGRIIAAGVDAQDDYAGWVVVWREQKLVTTFKDHSSPVCAIAFSIDSGIVVSADRNGDIILWNPITGKWRGIISQSHPTPIHTIMFFDITTLVTCDAHVLRCWYLEKKRGRGTTRPPRDVMSSESDDDSVFSDTQSRSSRASGSSDRVVSVTGRKTSLRAKLKWSRHSNSNEVSFDTVIPEYSEEFVSPRNAVKFRGAAVTPARTFTLLQSMRDCFILDQQTGEHVRTITTRAPLSAIAAGCTTAVAGDLWGNIYIIDFIMKNSLPTFT